MVKRFAFSRTHAIIGFMPNLKKASQMTEDKRINQRLQAYWEELRGQRPYPKETEIDPEAIADIWESCFLVNVQEGSKYTYLGQSLIEAYGDDLNDKEVCERLVYPSNSGIALKFQEVVDSKGAVVDEGEFINKKNLLIKYRSCMLPLGDEAGEVGFIIGGMKWRAY